MSLRSKGSCRYCGKEYTKSSMVKHIASCKERKTWQESKVHEKKAGYFSIWVEGTYCKKYWMLLEAREDAALKDLDKFLREIWLECCGHLSTFLIDGVHYDVQPTVSQGWAPTKSMNYQLKNILDEGMQFEYEYDFGSTTDLTLKVFNYRTGYWQKDKIIVMSRNKPIQELCDECGKNAAAVVCAEDGELLCNGCKDGHECGEEVLLRLANSPRSGVCAYEGSLKYPDEMGRI